MNKSECLESFFLIESSLLKCFGAQGESGDLTKLVSEIKKGVVHSSQCSVGSLEITGHSQRFGGKQTNGNNVFDLIL